MTDKERKSCIRTIEILRRLAFNVHGVMDIIDAQNCDKVIEMLNEPEPHWIPCSEYPEYDFEDVLVRWHDKRKGCEDDYILCEGYVVRKHWCCIFEDEDMSDYEPVEWVPISQRRMNHE